MHCSRSTAATGLNCVRDTPNRARAAAPSNPRNALAHAELAQVDTSHDGQNQPGKEGGIDRPQT